MHAPTRLVCFVALFLLPACGGEVEGGDFDPTDGGDAVTGTPWLMWGNTQTLTLSSVGPSTPAIPIATQQLLQVFYKRPESWHFFCSAKLISVTPAAPAGGIIQLDYLMQFGVGRSTIVIPNFVHFEWDPNTDVTQQRWTAVAKGPVRFNGDTTPNLTDEFTAQSIQAQANLTYVQLPGPYQAVVEVAMHVAPKAHVRPDWFRSNDPHNVKKFRGSETEGQ
jgi:hypothetical protein